MKKALTRYMNKELSYFKDRIFRSFSSKEFEKFAIELFYFQIKYNLVYKKFVKLIKKINPKTIEQIPFLPIEFFKTERVIIDGVRTKKKFESSGTENNIRSLHFVTDINIFIICHSFFTIVLEP